MNKNRISTINKIKNDWTYKKSLSPQLISEVNEGLNCTFSCPFLILLVPLFTSNDANLLFPTNFLNWFFAKQFQQARSNQEINPITFARVLETLCVALICVCVCVCLFEREIACYLTL